jgi:hypothetical protein
LQRQHADTLRPLEGVSHAASGVDAVRGWVPADRLSAEHAHRARQPGRQRHKTGVPKAAPLLLAGGGRVVICARISEDFS